MIVKADFVMMSGPEMRGSVAGPGERKGKRDRETLLLRVRYYKKMELLFIRPVQDRARFYKWASALALITILYNVIEGAVSVFFGAEDGTIALFGFGLDSFVEVVSGIGIWHMIRRMKQSDAVNHDSFEKRALQITGGAFYVLAAGLVATSVLNIYREGRPETTFWGIVVSVSSILSMWLLIRYKMKIGKEYNSQALIADANCSKACLYLSVVLLVSSIGYEVTGIGMIDSLGAVGIAVFAFREGREAFGKSKGNLTCGCQGKCH
jgi:divalent metal cation (Fe/Co/Zn/Cd) transporter